MSGFGCAFLFAGVPLEPLDASVAAVEALAARAVFEGAEVFELEALCCVFYLVIAIDKQQLRDSRNVDCGVDSLRVSNCFDDWCIPKFGAKCIDDENLASISLAVLPVAHD